ncbi:peptide deformylase [Deferribacteraceae bacterium V6Fe1]|jgi:peptide deformylase|nr:polypeptide deformylase [Deferribacteraceae bacterium]UOD35306.1 peptide deformylase [Deferribacteraceae bacterium V6Fe1]
MAIKEVLTYPNPLLKEISEEVKEVTPDVKDTIIDLIDTMDSTGHSVGIAAPQIGKLYRIIAVDASKNKKCTNHHGKMVMINPEILKWEGMLQFREGCMSLPDYTGNVNRARKILVQYQDEKLNTKVIEAEEFEAVLIQHEIDHLDGVLFIDRIISKRTDLFRRKKYK